MLSSVAVGTTRIGQLWLEKAEARLEQMGKDVGPVVEMAAGFGQKLESLADGLAQIQADLHALLTFKERFWWYMGAIVFLYMVLTISVVQSIR